MSRLDWTTEIDAEDPNDPENRGCDPDARHETGWDD